jgi:tetratricopeptide (TPR) repeat protein
VVVITLRHALAVLVLASCNRAAPRAAPDAAASVVADATATPLASAKRDASAMAVIGPAERRAYAAALREGRKHTLAKNYPAAITAFTQALKAVPEDGRAYSERGYARYLAGDYDAADDDLEVAVAAIDGDDKKLLAQVEFNLGLVNDASEHKGVAAGHFHRSYDLNPTDAARKRMGGCPVTSGPPTIKLFANKMEAINTLGDADADYVPATDAAGAYVHQRADATGVGTDVLVPIDGGRLARVDVGSIMMWHCGSMGEIDITRESDVWKVVYQAHRASMSQGLCMCDDDVCSPSYGADHSNPPCKCDSPFCPMVCGGADNPEGTYSETYVDAKTGVGLGSFELDHDYLGSGVKLEVDLVKRTFTAAGLGCN